MAPAKKNKSGSKSPKTPNDQHTAPELSETKSKSESTKSGSAKSESTKSGSAKSESTSTAAKKQNITSQNKQDEKKGEKEVEVEGEEVQKGCEPSDAADTRDAEGSSPHLQSIHGRESIHKPGGEDDQKTDSSAKRDVANKNRGQDQVDGYGIVVKRWVCDKVEDIWQIFRRYAFEILVAILVPILVAILVANLAVVISPVVLFIRSGVPPTKIDVGCQESPHPADDIQNMSSTDVHGQTPDFWKVIKSNIRGLSGYERPACVVISPEDADSDAKRHIESLSRYSSCALSGTNRTLMLNGDDFANGSALQDELDPWFIAKNRVAVIYNIDLLSVVTAKVFYKYCDDNPGPDYPRTLLYLTVSHSKEETIDIRWLDKRLRSSWSNDDDVITPILSRVGHRVAVMTRVTNP